MSQENQDEWLEALKRTWNSETVLAQNIDFRCLCLGIGGHIDPLFGVLQEMLITPRGFFTEDEIRAAAQRWGETRKPGTRNILN